MCENCRYFSSQHFSLFSRMLTMIFIRTSYSKVTKIVECYFWEKKNSVNFHTPYTRSHRYRFISCIWQWCVIKWNSRDWRSWLVYCAGNVIALKYHLCCRFGFSFSHRTFSLKNKIFFRETRTQFSVFSQIYTK
jgi:hypothetical protein